MLQVGMRAKKMGRKLPTYTTGIQPAINYTKKCFSAGFNATKMAPEKVFTVVYERLIMDPESETKKMCDFLKIKWSSQMIHPGSFKHLGEKAITLKSGEIWYDSKMYNKDPDPKNIEKWKMLLSPTQQVIIAMSFKDYQELAQLGFHFSIDNLSKLDRILGVSYKMFFSFSQKVLHDIFYFARKIPGIEWLGRRLINFMRT
ncbi:MAG: hypothetical protein GWP10_06320 [Nitrospiraceae bacterium]|nr:hypothetical protein [Nitrospiraceae bacterium]